MGGATTEQKIGDYSTGAVQFGREQRRTIELRIDQELINWLELQLTETQRQRKFIFGLEDHQCPNCKEIGIIPRAVNELQHIISPRAVFYGTLSILLRHGPDYLEGLADNLPLEDIRHDKLSDDFFRRFLAEVKTSNELMEELPNAIPLPITDPRIIDMLNRYMHFMRVVTTDPRNTIGVCRMHNNQYTPLRGDAYKEYRKGKRRASPPFDESDPFTEMQRTHQLLAYHGRTDLLVPPYAEQVQEYAIARVSDEQLAEYQLLTNKWRKKYDSTMNHDEALTHTIWYHERDGYKSHNDILQERTEGTDWWSVYEGTEP